MSSLRNQRRTEFPQKVKAAALKRCMRDGVPFCESCPVQLNARTGAFFDHKQPDGLGGDTCAGRQIECLDGWWFPCPSCSPARAELQELAHKQDLRDRLTKGEIEISRLQEANRLALRLADERAKEASELRAERAWKPIETAPKDKMFIWAYRLDGEWRLGLAYRNVSGRWSDAYASDAPRHATHWAPLPSPPVASTERP